jgi:hypothetical protein
MCVTSDLGLAEEFPDQAQAPPLKPRKEATAEETAGLVSDRAAER